jgi:hypothetical protein
MRTLDNVTLIAVAGTKAVETLQAMRWSQRGIRFASAKLITPDPVTPVDGIEVINCEPLNYEQYNHFIVYRLHQYVETAHALIVQNDGYVANPEMWDDGFLDWDYIGAPWPLPQDDFSFRDPEGVIQRVGNGGFSLRSKRLLAGAEQLRLEWKPFFGFYHEDGFFSCHHRKDYESIGCRYAPIEVAAQFAHELDIEENKGILPFGFHGKNNYYYHTTQRLIQYLK